MFLVGVEFRLDLIRQRAPSALSVSAAAIGVLMNARGLMELIILNIGYERGIITQTLFSIMVMMAFITTLMATPLFELVHGRRGRLLGTVGPVRDG
jgi:Kef-type K+ transport system membrane component KefB